MTRIEQQQATLAQELRVAVRKQTVDTRRLAIVGIVLALLGIGVAVIDVFELGKSAPVPPLPPA